MTAPLAGVTVVALEQAVAVPLASRNLADLGARVIKIERTGTGDLAREYDHVVHGTGAHFVWLNRGKESMALDLKSERGLAAARSLIDGADVFLQNLAPGAADRLGLGADTLRERHRELIVCNLSGYGAGGPLAARKAYDMLIQAEAGLISITGTTETGVKTGVPSADIASGLYCAQAVLAALVRRGRTGEGAEIEVSMLEATVEWMGHSMYTQMYTGRQPPRMGIGHVSIAPYDAFPTADGEILIGVQSDGGWRALTHTLGIEWATADPRFATNIDRVRNRAACDAVVAAETVRRTADELDTLLAAAGVPAARINDLDGVVHHPQLRARDRWRRVGTEGAEIDALLPPATFADAPAQMGDVPAHGEHTCALLREAGLSAAQIEELLTAGVARQSDRHPGSQARPR